MRNTLSPLGQIRMTKSGKYCMRPRKSWARTLRAVNRQQNTDISLVPDYPTAAQDKPENIFNKNPHKNLSNSLLQFQKYFSKGVNRSSPLTISRANKDAALSWHFPAISIGSLISNSENKLMRRRDGSWREHFGKWQMAKAEKRARPIALLCFTQTLPNANVCQCYASCKINYRYAIRLSSKVFDTFVHVWCENDPKPLVVELVYHRRWLPTKSGRWRALPSPHKQDQTWSRFP